MTTTKMRITLLLIALSVAVSGHAKVIRGQRGAAVAEKEDKRRLQFPIDVRTCLFMLCTFVVKIPVTNSFLYH